MSNQEAIALLRNLEDSLDAYCELNEEGKTAFRMAIEALSYSEFPNSVEFDVEDIKSIINEQDAADVVEVVRCKNCKYNAKGDNESEFWNICTLRPLVYVPVSDEDYCSRGEKKDDGRNDS